MNNSYKMRNKFFLDENVLVAAKARLRKMIAQFDNIYVSFSGGKDSWAVLTLLEQIYQEDGIDKKVDCVFNDEELITTEIVDFLKYVHDSDRFNLVWLAIPMQVGMYLLGKYHPFISWDTSRTWHREPPEYAVRSLGVDTSTCDEYVISKHVMNYLYPTGSVCNINGIRADESAKRLTAVTAKVGDNYLSTPFKRLWVSKPIYDWAELDIFKWLYESNNGYCSVYDLQAWAGLGLRVSTILNDRAKDKLASIKCTEPVFYEALVKVIPEVELSFRYGASLDMDAVINRYQPTFEGLRLCAKEIIGPELLDDAMTFIKVAESRRNKGLSQGLVLGNMPLRRLFKAIYSGSFWGNTPKTLQPSLEDLDFENKTANN